MKKILKSKLGFTLIELLIVVLIMGVLAAVAIPMYNSLTKKSQQKACGTLKQDIFMSVRNWCTENAYNDDFTFKISSDVENKTGVLLTEAGTTFDNPEQYDLLYKEVFREKIPYCPSGGTYTVTLEKTLGIMVKIDITCDGSEGTH